MSTSTKSVPSFRTDWSRTAKKHVQHTTKTVGSVGGIDLQLLGLGNNGHIGFNRAGRSIRERDTLR